MKRGLVLTLCAVAMTAFCVTNASADVDVALNLNYIDPADPSEGGSWSLVAKIDTASTGGISALVVDVDNINADGVVNGSIGHNILGGLLGVLVSGSSTEMTYGQDPGTGITNGVGTDGGPSDQDLDPLLNSVWDDASVIATGTFGALRPLITAAAGNEYDASDVVGPSTMDLVNTRGDSLRSLGLEDPLGSPNAGLYSGDANRDGNVENADLNKVLINFPLAQGSFGWDDGDFNDDGNVSNDDLNQVLIGFPLTDFVPPAIGAVPEPSTLALGLIMFSCGLMARRRS